MVVLCGMFSHALSCYSWRINSLKRGDCPFIKDDWISGLLIYPHSSFIHSFISIAPLQVHFYSGALPTQHQYCDGVSRRSATGNCELRTCPRSQRGSYSGNRTYNPPAESCRLNQCAITNYLKFLSGKLYYDMIKNKLYMT